MVKIVVLIANGTEEIEVVTPIDLLRRSCEKGDSVQVVKVGDVNNESLMCTCSNKTKIVSDIHIKDLDFSVDLVVVPGGYGGATEMKDSKKVVKLLESVKKEGNWIGSICASPHVVLQTHGFLDGKKSATCYPSIQSKLPKEIKNEEKQKRVCQDGKLVTSQGPGTAFEFSLKLIECVFGKEKMEKIAKQTVFK